MPPLVEMLLYLSCSGAFLALLYRLHLLKEERSDLQQQKEVVLNFMHDIAGVFTEKEVADVAALLKRVLFYAMQTTQAGAGALYLREEDDVLHAQATAGVFPPLSGAVDAELQAAFSKVRYLEKAVRRQTYRTGEGLVGEVVARGKPLLIDDEEDPRVPQFTAEFLRVHSLLLVPMRFHQRVIGVLAVANRVDGMAFTESQCNLLQALADQASVSVHHARVAAAMEATRRLNYDLSIASQVQEALLPRSIPQAPGLEVAAFCVPAQKIGGDYYDFIAIDATHFGVAVADVSGKGIAAALVMAIVRSAIRTEARGCTDPAAVLRRVNASVIGDIAEDMFVSILYMVFSTDRPAVAVARAGHPQPIVIAAGGGEPRTIQSRGMAMGMADVDTFDAVMDSVEVPLRPGDMVFGYTDGVTEAQDGRRTEWGLLNLMQSMQATARHSRSADSVARNVRRQMMEFAGDQPQYDDMTFVGVRYREDV